jgi:hypothetical protein
MNGAVILITQLYAQTRIPVNVTSMFMYVRAVDDMKYSCIEKTKRKNDTTLNVNISLTTYLVCIYISLKLGV